MREEHAQRSIELERACDFTAAAREALLADDPRRAVVLAALGGDVALAEEACAQIRRHLSAIAGLAAARELASKGFGALAGDLFEAFGEALDAARAFADAGDARRAARCFERAGRPADGARVLEAALRARPVDAALRVALGGLLARHGRTEAAVKALQGLDPKAPERAAALPLLRRCLVELGFAEAAKTLEDEMRELGVEEDEPARDPLPERAGVDAKGPLILGRYQTIREVAVTPNARVVEALDRVTGDRVAVKLLAGLDRESGRDALLRFEREAIALGKLRHPHVVPLVAYHPEGPATVLAWMAGGSLADHLAAREAFAPARAIEIGCALLSVLGEAHRLGILHRDVKPSNVLFDEGGSVHLADFGAAHLGDLSSTATSGAIGTFTYMSPEQRLGRPATIQSDIFAVGVIIVEMLTGDVEGSLDAGEVPLLSASHADLRPDHDRVIARLLQQDPSKRPDDAFEARRLLQSIVWSSRVLPRRARASRRPSNAAPSAGDARLVPSSDAGDGRDVSRRMRDTWIGRDVLVIPIEGHELAVAQAFARAGHPALPTVLKADVSANELWVAPPLGRSLADERHIWGDLPPNPPGEHRGLSARQLARVREAIEALHAVDGAHGAIDAEHLYGLAGEVSLAYPRLPWDERAAERDREALAALEREVVR